MSGIILLLALAQQIGKTNLPAIGSILAATEKSHDPDLARSVILVIHSDRDGVMGLILNRPREQSIYFGGPIPLGTRALIRSRIKPAGAARILGDVYLVSKKSEIPKDSASRVYAGYVGWSAQQLTDEIALGLWKMVHGDAATVFDPHPETLWRRYLR